MELRVVLVPVTAQLADDAGPARFSAYRPGGSWLSSPLEQADVLDVLRRLIDEVPGLLPVMPGRRPPVPESVTFRTNDDGTDLVFTWPLTTSTALFDDGALPIPSSPVPLPFPGPLRPLDPAGEDWVLLPPALPPASEEADDTDRLAAARQAVRDSDPIGYAVLDHWRHLLTDTSAVFDLLPRFFTTEQVRSVYESVWGGPQESDSFEAWLHGSDGNGGLCTLVPPDAVLRAMTDEVKAWRRAHGDVPSPLDVGAWVSALPELSRSLAARGPDNAGLPSAFGAIGSAVQLAANVLGAGIGSWMGGRSGEEPVFRRSAATRQVLKQSYQGRPAWLVWGMPPHGGRSDPE